MSLSSRKCIGEATLTIGRDLFCFLAKICLVSPTFMQRQWTERGRNWGDVMRQESNSSGPGERGGNRSSVLKSMRDFCWSTQSVGACSGSRLSSPRPLCSLSISDCLNTEEAILLQRAACFHLGPHLGLFFSSHCMEISPLLIPAIYPDVTHAHLTFFSFLCVGLRSNVGPNFKGLEVAPLND